MKLKSDSPPPTHWKPGQKPWKSKEPERPVFTQYVLGLTLSIVLKMEDIKITHRYM